MKNHKNTHTPETSIEQRRKQPASRRHTPLTIIISFTLIIICSCIFGSSFSSAHEPKESNPVKCKYYKSIQVQEGDSLWSIAEDNMSEEYSSIDEYLNEIITINHIPSWNTDHIQEGTYLTIGYYDEI